MASGEARIREFLWIHDSLNFVNLNLFSRGILLSIFWEKYDGYTESWNDLNLIGFIAMNGVKFNESR